MTKVQEHYKRILKIVQLALDDGVNVLIGGDPAVVQVTLGKESYAFRTVPGPYTMQQTPHIKEYIVSGGLMLNERCNWDKSKKPVPGFQGCTRQKGHDGPCAHHVEGCPEGSACVCNTILDKIKPSKLRQPATKEELTIQAKRMGYTGQSCGICGSFRISASGTCGKCEDCGATGGCS